MYISSFFFLDFFTLGSQREPHFQWNIGCVGSLALGLCVGHVHFIFFVLISFALGSRRKRSFQWNMGLSVEYLLRVKCYEVAKLQHLAVAEYYYYTCPFSADFILMLIVLQPRAAFGR